ncbi:hypothetical protein ACOALZ_11815 [Nocardiopsis algeriensis]|uniref:hypothetical protein n=1 Tax=Nocardiopsis algeriensis TaxID=1478215 RepID=UPI003B42BE00
MKFELVELPDWEDAPEHGDVPAAPAAEDPEPTGMAAVRAAGARTRERLRTELETLNTALDSFQEHLAVFRRQEDGRTGPQTGTLPRGFRPEAFTAATTERK